MKYLILFVVVAVIVFPKETNNQTINQAQQEWEQFCQVYMKWVKRYPLALDPGECV
tara:strand:+ start:674 stop:841 length:168 start_codon:yes stop_codon:yes gene_type:complete